MRCALSGLDGVWLLTINRPKKKCGCVQGLSSPILAPSLFTTQRSVYFGKLIPTTFDNPRQIHSTTTRRVLSTFSSPQTTHSASQPTSIPPQASQRAHQTRRILSQKEQKRKYPRIPAHYIQDVRIACPTLKEGCGAQESCSGLR